MQLITVINNFLSKFLVGLFAVLIAIVVLPAQADDLMQVYYQALHSDPTFKEAQATWLSSKEALPIARAGYLPQLTAAGAYTRSYERNKPGTVLAPRGYFWAHNFNLSLSQAIFNAATWKAIKGAAADVKSATATYAAAQQDLMVRTVTAYLSVLQAYDRLRFTLAKKRAVYRQLVTAEQQFRVGLIAITGVYDAQTVYDQAIADEIQNRNDLNNRLEDLRAITGKHYRQLTGLTRQVPLFTPKPNDINEWVRVSELQNYTLQAQDYTVQATHQNIGQQQAGRYPVVNLVGTYGTTYTSDDPVGFNTSQTNVTAGLSINFPLFQGGLVSASVRRAIYDYESAVSQLDFVHRDVVRQTRQAFLGVISGISRVKAALQAIVSQQKALKATEAGYTVGTRTMVDVLNDLSTLYNRQQQYADDQYAYVSDIISLKEAAGTLSVKDLEQVNSWFSKSIRFKLSPEVYGLPPRYVSTRYPKKKESDKTTTKDNKKDKVTQQKADINSITKVNEKDKVTQQKTDINSTTKDNEKDKITQQKTDVNSITKNKDTVPNDTTTQPQNNSNDLNSKSVKPDDSDQKTNKQIEENKSYNNSVAAPVKKNRFAYAIQLFASHEQKKAMRFLKAQELKSKLRVVRWYTWYKVVYGQYKDISDARVALKELPTSLRKNKAWITIVPQQVRKKSAFHKARAALLQLPGPKVTAEKATVHKKVATRTLPAPAHTH